MRSRKFSEGQRKKEIEIQTLWENSDPLGAIVCKAQMKIKNTGRIASSVYTMVSLFTVFAPCTTCGQPSRCSRQSVIVRILTES